MIAKEELIEYARYVENYYGTPREYVEQKLDEGKDVILEIEIQGALKVKEGFPGYPAFVCHAAQRHRAERTPRGQRDRDNGRDQVQAGPCL